MRHWYIVFNQSFSREQINALLQKWGTKLEDEQPQNFFDKDTCLAVEGPNDLRSRVKEVEGVEAYDNEVHQELYSSSSTG
jgi:hypothetical protein